MASKSSLFFSPFRRRNLLPSVILPISFSLPSFHCCCLSSALLNIFLSFKPIDTLPNYYFSEEIQSQEQSILPASALTAIASSLGILGANIPIAQSYLRSIGALFYSISPIVGVTDSITCLPFVSHLICDISRSLRPWIEKKKRESPHPTWWNLEASMESVTAAAENASTIVTRDDLDVFFTTFSYPKSILDSIIGMLLASNVAIMLGSAKGGKSDPCDPETRFFFPTLLPVTPRDSYAALFLMNECTNKLYEGDFLLFEKYPKQISALLESFGPFPWDVASQTSLSPSPLASSASATSRSPRDVSFGTSLGVTGTTTPRKKIRSCQPTPNQEVGRFYQFEFFEYEIFAKLMGRFLQSIEIVPLLLWQTGMVFRRDQCVVFLGADLATRRIILHIRGLDLGHLSLSLSLCVCVCVCVISLLMFVSSTQPQHSSQSVTPYPSYFVAKTVPFTCWFPVHTA
jgi:hypothetical protein